jgi:hypothetical protein
MMRVNTLNDGIQNNKMTATNQNHLHKELKRGEGNSPFTSESVVFHIFMDGCFLLKKTILVWILMTTGSGLWWLTVRLLILQHSNSSVTT